jgi:hypothetical protein
MTHIIIDDIDPTIVYAVSASRSSFPVPFAFFESSNLVVTVGSTVLVLNTDYTVSGTAVDAGFSSGTVTLITAVTSTTVTIARVLPIKRTTDFPNSGPFSIPALNTEHDKFVAIMQQLADGQSTFSANLADAISLFETLINADTTVTLFATRATITLANIDAATTYIRTAGYATVGDGGAALYVRISAPSPVKAWHVQSADGAYWLYTPAAGANPYAFGAKGIGSSFDDTTAFQAAVDYQQTFGGYVEVPAPSSYFAVTSVTATGGSIVGAGRAFVMRGVHSGPGPFVTSPNVSIIKGTASTGDMFYIVSNYGVLIENIKFGYSVAGNRGAAGAALHLSGPISPSPHYMSYPQVINCTFEQQYFAIQCTNVSGGSFERNHFFGWAHSAIYSDRTDSTIEISLGDLIGNHFFGDSTAGTSSIASVFSQGGYLRIVGGGMVGCQYGVLIDPVSSAGFTSIMGVSIEESQVTGVNVQNTGGGILAQLQIVNCEFSVTAVPGAQSHIAIRSGANPTYLTGFEITGNTFRSIMPLGIFIDIQSGANGTVKNNTAIVLGGSVRFISVSGTQPAAPIEMSGNLMTVQGGTGVRYAVGVSTIPIIVDLQGTAFADLPQCANGSSIYVTDGKWTGGGNYALIGGGLGVQAIKVQGTWFSTLPF